jgi:diguanylate cyclase (GGDEF)-like protein
LRTHDPDERPETSGMTTRLVLLYVEREAGPDAVDEILERIGRAGERDRLLDEDAWFSWQTKIDLFQATTEVLGDRHAMRQIGQTILELEVSPAMKLALKALGSPAMVYRNVVRANARFCRSHEMTLVSEDAGRAEIEFASLADGRAHRLECDYVAGLLSSVPELFGREPADVDHRRCVADGADVCRFSVAWDLAPGRARRAISRFAAAITGHRRRERHLEMQLAHLGDATERLAGSLQDVVSELRVEDVLAKITANARAAVGGSDFALLLDGPDGLRVQSSSEGVDAATLDALERWAVKRPYLLRSPQLIDDLAEVGGVPAEIGMHSVCAAPLVARGEPIGLLVALSGRPRVFLPRDLAVLEAYAAQTAIAVTNARLYEAQAALATRDPLTGLLNHRAFHEELDRALEEGDPAVVLLDLDGFKQVNDTDGHAAGDELLRAVARALRGSCRADDLVCRLGGDEFAVLLPHADPLTARAVARRVAEAVDGADPRTRASYGLATTPADGTTKEALLVAADERLYAAKRERGARRSAPHGLDLLRESVALLEDALGPERAAEEVRRRLEAGGAPAALEQVLAELERARGSAGVPQA